MSWIKDLLKSKPCTGYSSCTCKLRQWEEIPVWAKESFKTLAVGKYCVLRWATNAPDELNNIGVWYKNQCVGFVTGSSEMMISEALLAGHIAHSVVESMTPNKKGVVEICIRVYFTDPCGTVPLPPLSDNIDWFVHYGDRYSKETAKHYHAVWETYEMIYRNLKDYHLDDATNGVDPDWQNILEEDDAWMERFINEYNRGFIQETKDKRTFLREASKDRWYGDNTNLRKRISDYLKVNDIYLIS